MLKLFLNSRKYTDTGPTHQDNLADNLPEPRSLPPVSYQSTSSFEQVISTHQDLDKLILQQLRPAIPNKQILAPIQYEKLLLSATETLSQINQQSNNSVCEYCRDMLEAEISTIEFIHSKKQV